MSSNRPNLAQPQPSEVHLALDEQSFQDLLAAAFTIQEHNDRRRNRQSDRTIDLPGDLRKDLRDLRTDVQTDLPADLRTDLRKDDPGKPAPPAAAEAESRPGPEATSLCPQCGAAKLAAESRCQNCRLEELRPGERLQRNWASMWLMSQEQGLWPERSPEFHGHPRETSRNDVTVRTTERPPFAAREELPPQDSDLPVPTFHLPASDHAFAAAAAGETTDELTDYATESSPDLDAGDAGKAATSLLHRLADFRVTLRFHRADLYLGTAICVAALALLWPAAPSPRRPVLGPWERALITLGIAEAPTPAVHFQGNPAIEVWVDPHTALYYCPGEEQYGKTADGRLSSQREAQMERFEPSARAACE